MRRDSKKYDAGRCLSEFHAGTCFQVPDLRKSGQEEKPENFVRYSVGV